MPQFADELSFTATPFKAMQYTEDNGQILKAWLDAFATDYLLSISGDPVPTLNVTTGVDSVQSRSETKLWYPGHVSLKSVKVEFTDWIVVTPFSVHVVKANHFASFYQPATVE